MQVKNSQKGKTREGPRGGSHVYMNWRNYRSQGKVDGDRE